MHLTQVFVAAFLNNGTVVLRLDYEILIQKGVKIIIEWRDLSVHLQLCYM